jgi:hypothetical protein
MQDRIRGKGKGKEMLYRMEGETVDEEDGGFREDTPVIRDPRKDKGVKRPMTLRSGKSELVVVKFQVSFKLFFCWVVPFLSSRMRGTKRGWRSAYVMKLIHSLSIFNSAY